MADFASSPAQGGYTFDSHTGAVQPGQANTLATFTNFAGAAISLALVVGIGIWGYQLLARDVSGIPIVKAASGEMRVRPEDPGGLSAQHQGLSVNAVAAAGTAAAPADQLRLAPKPVDLDPEDGVMVATAPQAMPDTQGLASTQNVAAAMNSGDVSKIVEELTRGVVPLTELAPLNETTSTQVAAAAPQATAPRSTIIDAPGVRQSLRPRNRPRTLSVAVATPTATPTTTASSVVDVDAKTLPAGTRLAQLGAFESAEIAQEQWGVISARFGDYFEGKKRIIQRAKSGGRTFYRLRAMGFSDIADARRFCSTLVASNADCIPVVTR